VPKLPWLVYAMLLAPLGLILIAAAVKTWQAREARSWPQTSGKVLSSVAEVRDVRVSDDDREDGYRLEQHNFANVVYEYSVGGRKVSGNRISIGEDTGDFQVAEKLAKYPAGSIVTVYYNPRHPEQAVLERDLPKGMWGCLGIGSAIVLAIVFGSAFGVNQGYHWISTHIGRPDLSGMVIGFGAFGLVVGLFALMAQRQESLAKQWPVVSGTIKLSEVEEYREAADDEGRPGLEMFGRRVSYIYSYQNVSYTNEYGRVASQSPSTSNKMMSRYHDGAVVEVHVNPDNPSEATLEVKQSGKALVLWLVAGLFAAAALFVATRGG
jgi:hypothetical protein